MVWLGVFCSKLELYPTYFFFLYSNGILFKICVNFVTRLFSNLKFLTLQRFHEIFQDNFMKLTVFLQVTTCAGQFVCLCFEKISLSKLYAPSTDRIKTKTERVNSKFLLYCIWQFLATFIWINFSRFNFKFFSNNLSNHL